MRPFLEQKGALFSLMRRSLGIMSGAFALRNHAFAPRNRQGSLIFRATVISKIYLDAYRNKPLSG
jgi:hypothetical protein